MTTPTLYMMFGYPGAGKTTIAKLISEITGATRLSSDEMRLKMFESPKFSETEHSRLYEELNNRTEKLLAEGISVIFDANLNRYQHRQEKYDICKKLGAKSVLIWVKTARELSKERATHQSRAHFVPNHETAGSMFDRIADVIEIPLEDEPFISIDGTDTNPEIVKQAIKL